MIKEIWQTEPRSPISHSKVTEQCRERLLADGFLSTRKTNEARMVPNRRGARKLKQHIWTRFIGDTERNYDDFAQSMHGRLHDDGRACKPQASPSC
jgi:hypothetical protein